MSLELRADRKLIRAEAHSRRYVVARIEAPVAPGQSGRLPVNIAFVLDRSGSMHGEKIRLAREAVLTAIRSLHDVDRFSVVIYDNEIDVLVPSTSATASARREAESIVRRVEARGMTDLAGGWFAGCEQVAEALDAAAVGRCLLLTDGLANRGVTDHEALVDHAREFAGRGIATTTFGVGRDFDEQLLGQIADAGSGAFYYVESAAQIPDFMASEVGEALEVVARDVRLVVEAPAGVAISLLNDLRTTQDGRRLTIDVGTLVSEQLFAVVLKLELPRGSDRAELLVTGTLTDRDGVLAHDAGSAAFTYASHTRNDAQERDRMVEREVAAVYAARARATALDLNDRGRYVEAQGVLSGTARRIAGYAAEDAELLAIVSELESLDASYARLMSRKSRKLEHMMSRSGLHSRDACGGARRIDDSRDNR